MEKLKNWATDVAKTKFREDEKSAFSAFSVRSSTLGVNE